MACDIATSRKAYGFELYENDNQFAGRRQVEKERYNVPTHLAQKQQPWNHLNGTSTLTSRRREVYDNDPQAPSDSLDFVLKAQYDHHNEVWRASNDTLQQPETLGLEHGRVLKNRQKEEPKQKPVHPLQLAVPQKIRESIHSINNAIESHHTQTTNRGYSRKPDGGFFAS